MMTRAVCEKLGLKKQCTPFEPARKVAQARAQALLALIVRDSVNCEQTQTFRKPRAQGRHARVPKWLAWNRDVDQSSIVNSGRASAELDHEHH